MLAQVDAVTCTGSYVVILHFGIHNRIDVCGKHTDNFKAKAVGKSDERGKTATVIVIASSEHCIKRAQYMKYCIK